MTSVADPSATFTQLGGELLAVNEQICRLRPVPEQPPTAQKKTAEAIQREVAKDGGQIEAFVKTLRELQPASAELAKTVNHEAEYFERNAHRMRYPDFRAQGLFVGSGVVEAGCKEVIGSRLKRSGMFWTVGSANAIIALRCCRLSGSFGDYWESLLGVA